MIRMTSLSLPIYLFFIPANPSDFSSFPGRLPAGMTVSLWAVARIPLRSRNDARSPEKSLFAAPGAVAQNPFRSQFVSVTRDD